MRKILFVAIAILCTYMVHGQIYTAINDLGEGITSTTISYLSSGEDINAKSKDYTLLNKAIESGKIDVAMILIEKGADVNLQTNKKSPLVFAAKIGDVALVKALIAAGARIDRAYEGDDSIVQIARRAGHMEVGDILQKEYSALRAKNNKY